MNWENTLGKLSLWQPNKKKDFQFQDRVIKEGFYVGSVGIFIHRYEGVIDQGDVDDKSQPSENQSETWNISTIQDMTFQENRNRKYSDNVFELRGHFSARMQCKG